MAARSHHPQQNRCDSGCPPRPWSFVQQFGIANPLPDPWLALYDANGTLLASNDNWQSDASQAALITGYGLAPLNNLESAVAVSLAPGRYTAIVTGKNNQTGIGLIEIYAEQ